MERPDKTAVMFLCELCSLKTLHNSLTKKLHFLHQLAQFVGQKKNLFGLCTVPRQAFHMHLNIYIYIC